MRPGLLALCCALLALGPLGCNQAVLPSPPPETSDALPDMRLVGIWKWSMIQSYLDFRADGSGASYAPRLQGGPLDSTAFAWTAAGGVLDLAWKKDGAEERREKASYRFVSNDVVDIKIPSAFWGAATRIASIPR